ncbi:metalloregulator ArsR/SmtB family transcription factor [Parahaliea sp. F7430]|uniref:Metalloregulator ArsR/SmtB family transcription factor n=1 Tax=Sediminihaliea albiluteola TaxID=2758564 RepID=A0A7W2TX58_9GAMM|nr:metalloregulator ArsR/SmtB family transcription factor [Sediminihaliea albiluteola]MBA6413548.1 metalloregulator ArsR/SmtB family transcription factor [Sediminihaliea albiluteola]
MLAPEAISQAPEEQLFDALAALCKASADPLRLQVLRVLRNDSFGVSELCSLFELRQPALSHHLKVLANAGLVATRREGNSIFYRRSELGQRPELEALQQQVFHSVDQIDLPEQLQDKLSELQRQREENSRNFFHLNAHKFREQQDLIASYKQYADTVAQVLRDAPLKQRRSALEIGPGDGAFLRELSPSFERVIAVDNAAAMLATAQANAAQAGLKNIHFIHGDSSSEQLADIEVDCVVINMVLHHTPNPKQILQDAAVHLAPDGVVLVTDLCRHDQAWARENCGDLWLGFEPEDLTQWAQAAGLSDIASVFLAQRNGFQIQVRLFGHL